jgi:hypothetical protein
MTRRVSRARSRKKREDVMKFLRKQILKSHLLPVQKSIYTKSLITKIRDEIRR